MDFCSAFVEHPFTVFTEEVGLGILQAVVCQVTVSIVVLNHSPEFFFLMIQANRILDYNELSIKRILLSFCTAGLLVFTLVILS